MNLQGIWGEGIWGEVPYRMLFDYEVILVIEAMEGIMSKEERQKEVLESKGFRISRLKIEYMHHNFSKIVRKNEYVV